MNEFWNVEVHSPTYRILYVCYFHLSRAPVKAYYYVMIFLSIAIKRCRNTSVNILKLHKFPYFAGCGSQWRCDYTPESARSNRPIFTNA